MQITTERLVLRDFVIDDWRQVLAYQREPRYLRLYPWSGRTESDARAFVQLFIDWQMEQPRRKMQLAITLPDDGPLIGNCGIRRESDNHWEADLGYELSPEYWGRGYATEAAFAMLNFEFQKLGLHRISSWCMADISASEKVLEKIGIRLEGRLRENENFKRRRSDTLLYGALENEWEPPSNCR